MTTTTLIVDASVAIKWYVPEVHTDIAQRLVEESWTLHAPELIFIEIGNIAWKQVRFGGATVADAIDIVHAALEVGIEVHRSSYLLGRALEIGLATQRTVYDSLFFVF